MQRAEKVADKVEAKQAPAENVTALPTQAAVAPAPKKSRGLTRLVLMVVLPALVLGGGAYWYLSGGRYVTTDDAFVNAPLVMVAPEVTGPIASVAVHEGQRVAAGDVLFTLDREQYEIALAEDRAALSSSGLELAALKENYAHAQTQIAAAQSTLDYQKRNFDRIQNLAGRQVSSVADLDKARNDFSMADQSLAAAKSASAEILAKLNGDPNLSPDRYPPVAKAKADIAAAERDLRKTEIRAPITGTATQTALLVPGRYLSPGTAAMALVDTDHAWVDANPKETDLEPVTAGDPVEVTVDAYPDHVFRGRVASISPGTGAQFSVLPAQNASGNWVKVVQRVPVRIEVDRRPDEPELRAGMSVYVSIDTEGAPARHAAATR